jgi:peptidoglycan/xylan/chitin deacetylase (PgdA/CDA1 family)
MISIRPFVRVVYEPLRFYNWVKNKLFHNGNSSVRVLLYHHIPANQEKKFHQQLMKLSKKWNFITPNEFEAYMEGHFCLLRQSLLLTFDDGFKSNKKVTDHILNDLGIKAIFFVVTEFISLGKDESSKQFISKNICPELSENDVPDDFINMTWNDLRDLIKMGHYIGGHTASHARLSKLSEENLKAEIVASADLLESKLNVPIRHFAFTFGDIHSFNKSAMARVASRYRYLHTGLGGFNLPSSDSLLIIRRDSVSPNDSAAQIGAMILGAADWHFLPHIRLLTTWRAQNNLKSK